MSLEEKAVVGARLSQAALWRSAVQAFLTLTLLSVSGGGDVTVLARASGPVSTLSATVDEVPKGLTAAAWTTMRTAIERDRYRVLPEGSTYRAVNHAQRLDVTFTPDGFEVKPRNADGTWRWGLRLSGYGYDDHLQPVTKAQIIATDNRIEYRRGDLVEWYVNDRRGLEQGFTLRRRPAGERGDGALYVHLKSAGDLIPNLVRDGKGIEWSDTRGTKLLRYGGLYVFDATRRELPARMELDHGHLTLRVQDEGAVYPVTIDPFIEQPKLLADDGTEADELGFSVAISGDTVIVGAPGDDSSKGAAYIFERTPGGAEWAQVARLIATDFFGAAEGVGGDRFGGSVSINQDMVVVGAPGRTSGRGAAYIFERDLEGANNWGRRARLDTGNLNGFGFGTSVATNGAVVIVGAPFLDDASLDPTGAVFIFERNRGGVNNWGGNVRRRPTSEAAQDQFGASVSLSGDTVIVGAPFNPERGVGAGAAYVIERGPGGVGLGTLTALNASDASAEDHFGVSVSISGDTAIAGADADDDNGTNSGAAYVFQRGQPGNLSLLLAPTLNVTSTLSSFGAQRAIDGDLRTSWFTNHGDAANLGGSPFFEMVFPRDVTVSELRMFGNRQLSASIHFLAGVFQLSAADGTVLFDSGVVGLPVPDRDLDLAVPNVAGVRRVRFTATADESDQPGFSELMVIGSAEGVATWGEVKKLTRTDPGAFDAFGASVSISAEGAIVGASRHDQGALGEVGAAYLFERNQGGADNWGQVGAKLVAGDAAADDNVGISVAISGATAIVGASGRDDRGPNSGAAYVFVSDPAASDDGHSVDEDTALAVPAPGVLKNDSDPDGAPLAAVLVSEPSHGTLTLNPDGSFSYEPGANFNGVDRFTYKASDAGGAESNTATVTVTVNPVNDAPSFTQGGDQTVDEDSGISNGAGGFVQTVPGWATAISAGPADEAGQTLTLTFLVTDDNPGIFFQRPKVAAADGTLTYTLRHNQHGTASVTVQLQDRGGILNGGADTSSSQTFTITVNSVNDRPFAATDPFGAATTTAEDTAIDIHVLANDGDPDVGDTVTVHSVTQQPVNGSASINPDGTVKYTPNPNFFCASTGPCDSFRYTVSDGTLVSFPARVDVRVTPVHDNPVAVGDTATVAEDSGVNAINVLANDSFGPDGGETLTITAVSRSNRAGTVAIIDGTSVSYTPTANFFGSDFFKYTISDGAGGSATAIVSVRVTAVNDAPVNIVPGPQTTPINQPLVFSAAVGNRISISDVEADALGSPMRVILTATNGLVSLSRTFGLAFATGNGTADLTMTFIGTIRNVNAALDGMLFHVRPGVGHGLTITTSDDRLFDTDTVPIGLLLQ